MREVCISIKNRGRREESREKLVHRINAAVQSTNVSDGFVSA